MAKVKKKKAKKIKKAKKTIKKAKKIVKKKAKKAKNVIEYRMGFVIIAGNTGICSINVKCQLQVLVLSYIDGIRVK